MIRSAPAVPEDGVPSSSVSTKNTVIQPLDLQGLGAFHFFGSGWFPQGTNFPGTRVRVRE